MKRLLIFLLVFAMAVPCLAEPADTMEGYLASAQKEGLLFGDENGELRENETATRAEFLTLLTRFLGLSGGENEFSDISDGDWFAGAVAAASFNGIFFGYDDGTARPYELIKTEDAIAVIGRYYSATEHKGKYSGVSDYATDYFGYAFENGIFSAWKHLPAPNRGITRGEIVSVLYRYREENDKNICFEKNYPRISGSLKFNTVSVDIKTSEDCALYYALRKDGDKGYNWTEISKSELEGGETLRINADMEEVYDLYIKAVSKSGGRTQIKELKNVAPSAFVMGYGTGANPYIIYTELQLSQIAAYPDKAYILGENIKISGSWKPIGNFTGSLKGDGYRITGLTIDGSGTDVGLFADINGGTVKNLSVDARITAKDTAGIIAGRSSGRIENCCVTGSVEVGNNNGGGICGVNSGEITNCLSCAYTVKAGSFSGGIAGQNRGTVRNCLSAVETVISDMYAGGIAGQNSGGVIEGCAAANACVYNTMAYNGGRISANKGGGVMKGNFGLADMVSNAAKTGDGEDSHNGRDASWDELKSTEFYYAAGWSKRDWKKASEGFELICPQNTAEPVLESGITQYYPKKIASADEFIEIGKNCKGHYALAADISLKAPWKTVDSEAGFSGVLDGRGHTVYNLTLKGENGLFSNITGGTIRDLNISGVSTGQSFEGGIIAACNYGYIENCSVTGEIKVKRGKKAGAVAGENNGRILGCTAEMTIEGAADNQIGGICAMNNGVIEKSSFSGSIAISDGNGAVGGICAYDNEGYITECAADIAVSLRGGAACIGGICASLDGSSIYKCASFGSCVQSGTSAVLGGICGAASGSAVYNCFSAAELGSDTENAVAGGICAICEGSNVQNTYSTGEIRLSGKNAVSGGICGAANGSYITQNAALNPVIYGKRAAGAIAAECDGCDLGGNYSHIRTVINSRPVIGEEKNGTVTAASEIMNTEFFLKPLPGGGALGWDEPAWRAAQNGYSLPILTDTPLMGRVSDPVYK